MEQCMENLRHQLLRYMGRTGCSMKRMSQECGISIRELNYILDGKKKDIRLSTVVRISEGIRKPLPCLISEEESKKYENIMFIHKLHAEISGYVDKAGI
ncbi:hypothetical protein C810_01433 [Lachnospiraceae bacterium A2]|nr:hypothetical protein C810_01433 [Lachnospiraceae bacterium A2]